MATLIHNRGPAIAVIRNTPQLMPICVRCLLTSIIFSFICFTSVAQTDTSFNKADTLFLLKTKGLLGKLVKNIVNDTADNHEGELQRNDLKYLRYRGKIIRNIELHNLPFGTPITDTSKRFTNSLIRAANFMHRDTRSYVIRNNLFFKKGDKVFPYLLADNERFLRNLEYIGDARIMIRRIPSVPDSVDIVVVTKDVLSIGGSFQLSSTNRFKVNIREANLGGWGDKISGRLLYDSRRNNKVGAGIEYLRRNIMGSFIDGYFGLQSITPTIIGGWEQERTLYARFLKPLVHPYMRWTYALDVASHKTLNQYQDDSLFKQDFKYKFYNIDAWGAFTTQVAQSAKARQDDRLRTLIGLRVARQQFQELPERYQNNYFYRYFDLTAVLASISIFRQDFYKTRYVYGFGITEDVPEGIDVSVTTGWTRKQQRTRNYAGLGLNYRFFNLNDHYFNYTLKLGGFNYGGKYEDIDLLANLEYFTNLRTYKRFKQRNFVTVGISRQFNTKLNEPLFLDSQYGLTEFANDSLFAGDLRATIQAESVFFTNWSLIGFKFAPFVFGNAAYLTGAAPESYGKKFFPSIGGGVRTRNESLIFGTLEFRAFYFPTGNFYQEHFRFEFQSNLKFKYNQQQNRKPDFITFN